MKQVSALHLLYWWFERKQVRLTDKAKPFFGAILTLMAADCLATQDMIVASDGKADDYFGYSVAVDGHSVLVGAYKADIKGAKNAGAAYVYVLNQNGWSQQAKLVAEPSFAEDTVAGKVALKNNVAALGAMNRDDKGENAGAVIIFERQSNHWQQTQIITAPDAQPGDAFGQSISLSDNYLIVGAPRNDALGKDSGAAYVYKRNKGKWNYQSKITASDGNAGDLFGISLDVDGSTMIVGADLHDEKAQNAGAAYIYAVKDKQWQQEAKLMALDGNKTDIFGVRVALYNNTALISARRDDIEEVGVDAGSAYIFERHQGVWTQKAKLMSPDGAADDRFGRSVALTKNTMIISAMNNDANGNDTGAAYIYKKESSSWSFSSKITAKIRFPYDRFGWTIALSDKLAVISTPNHDSKGMDSGAVFIHSLNHKAK